jgi:hypothetical protein
MMDMIGVMVICNFTICLFTDASALVLHSLLPIYDEHCLFADKSLTACLMIDMICVMVIYELCYGTLLFIDEY